MGANLTLTIDVGSTNMKGLVIDLEGRIIDKQIKEITLNLEGIFAGHDPKELLYSFMSILRYFGEKYGKSIEAISTTTYNHSMLLADHNGNPLTNIITYHDRRAAEVEHELLKKIDPCELYKETGSPPLFIFMPYKLYWFMKKRPQIFQGTKHILFCKDYLLWKSGLTNGPYIDIATASGGGTIDLRKLKYNEKILNLLGIDENKFPELHEGGTVLDFISNRAISEYGFDSNTKIILATFDGAAQNFGLGLTKKGAVLNIGTSSVIRKLCRQIVFDRSLEMRLFTFYAANGFYAIGGSSNNGGDCLRWFRDNFGQIEMVIGSTINVDPYQILDLEGEKIPAGSEGLIFIPFLTGERFPFRDPGLTGVFFGISRNCRREHFIRAIMEGVGYVLRAIQNALSENSEDIDELYFVGGGSNSRVWAQILADILNTSINVLMKGEDAANYGASALAFNALSIDSIEGFSSRWVKIKQKVSPIPKNKILYEENYARFIKLVKLVKEVKKKE